ncbi:vesicle transport through interaction with t-SNAREs homolog 1B [Atheta coriaria]|uniref:vesicle transport through interaction with t-SNAREs homolog 1B n=1 Tax=Dalotia coriaria TaxID=877792 RepID=UPI0031F3FE12
MYSGSDFDFEAQQRQTVLEGRRVLERTGQSLARSNQVAIETEQIGTTVVTELGEQRETLLRAKNRLSEADANLDQTRSILRRMGRNVLYNKMILILIIVLEIGILIAVTFIRFFRK